MTKKTDVRIQILSFTLKIARKWSIYYREKNLTSFICTFQVHFKESLGASTYMNHSVNRGSKKHLFEPENLKKKNS